MTLCLVMRVPVAPRVHHGGLNVLGDGVALARVGGGQSGDWRPRGCLSFFLSAMVGEPFFCGGVSGVGGFAEPG